ncbi:MAG: 4Fe-4S binding protein [Rhodoferax sp.]|nr:4Fe-4S binding protein [Rhodoferax sp.]
MMVRSLPIPIINTAGCTGCGRCVGACPLHLLSLEAKNWVKSAVIHGVEKCTGCGKCKTICPFNAIQMRRYVNDSH